MPSPCGPCCACSRSLPAILLRTSLSSTLRASGHQSLFRIAPAILCRTQGLLQPSLASTLRAIAALLRCSNLFLTNLSNQILPLRHFVTQILDLIGFFIAKTQVVMHKGDAQMPDYISQHPKTGMWLYQQRTPITVL